MSGGSSTGNLNRHLKLHPDKTNPSVKKQAELMKNFLQENHSQQIVNIHFFFKFFFKFF